MAQQTINVGTAPNDGTGTPLRTAFQYTNSNFSELYTALGGGSGLPGASTQVLFNNGTNIAGDAGLVYNSTTDALTIGGNVQAGSATITGDLTVDTNTLKVDSTNNRVGIGTASPISLAQFSGSTPTVALSDTNPSSGSFFNLLFRHTDGLSATYNIATIQGQTNGNGGNGNLIFFTASSNSNTERYKIDSTGVATWSNVGGVAGTAMTLNANGLGIGVTPSAWGAGIKGLELGSLGSGITSGGTYSGTLYATMNAYNDGSWKFARNAAAGLYGLNSDKSFAWFQSSNAPSVGGAITWTQAMTLDASGNLLVGVTSPLINTTRRLSVSGTVAAALQSTGAATVETINVWHTATSGNNIFVDFDTEAAVTSRGSISYNRAGGLVAYNTTSDYRAKDLSALSRQAPHYLRIRRVEAHQEFGGRYGP